MEWYIVIIVIKELFVRLLIKIRIKRMDSSNSV